MAKALKIVAAVTAVAALAVVTGGAALGLGVALSTTAFGVSASSLLVASAVLSAGASLLSPKPKVPSTSAATDDRLNVSVDLRTGRKIAFGCTAFSTDLRDQEYSADQTLLDRFVVVASHKVNSIQEIWFDDKQAWTSTDGVTAAYAGYLTVTPILEGSAANAIYTSARMGSSRRFTGCAYVRLRYKLTGNSSKVQSPFSGSVPTRVTIIGEGATLYDPRLDSTAGGAGPQRADDQTTWTWNLAAARNPALALLWYLFGWRIQNPATGEWKLAVGKGLPPARIDIASFITAANICDEPVSTPAGGTEPRYCCDGVFSETDDTGLVLDNLKAAMNAVLDDVDGKIRVTVLHNDLATPIGKLTAADVLGEFTWLQTPPLNDSINVIRGGYTDPSTISLYQLVDAPEVRIDSPDGIDRAGQPLNMPVVQSVWQWLRLAKQRLQRALYGGTFTAVFQATAWKFQKGDVVQFDFFPLGFGNKLFRIADMTIQVDGTVPMMLREEHPDIYAAYNDASAPIVGAAPTLYDPTLWPVVQGIIDAGKTADWPAIADTDPTRPRPQDGATVGAPIGTKVGGRAVIDVLSQLDRIVPAEQAIVLLKAADADLAAANAQAARDRAVLSEALLRMVTEADRTRAVFRDAGIVIDPVNGKARIYAVDQLADRTSQAEIAIDATKALVGLKASVDDVNQAIVSAQLTPGAQVDFTAILARLTSAEISINGLQASILLKADAVTVTALGGVVTSLSTSFDALTGIVATKASSTSVDQLGTRIGSVEQTISTLGDVSGISVTIRQARQASDTAAEATLRALLAGDDAGQRQITQLAQVRQEAFARIDDGLAAEATARTLLNAQMADVDARLGQELLVRATLVSAQASRIDALQVTVGQNGAAITSLQQATADQFSSIAQAITQLTSGQGDQHASIEFLLRTVNGNDAVAQLVTDVHGRITGFRINGASGDFLVAAEHFVVGDSTIFSVDTGTRKVRMHDVEVDTLKAGIVSADKLVGSAVTKTVFLTTTAPVTIAYG